MASYAPVKLAYNKYKSESGGAAHSNPVIFLHGLTESKEHWYDIPQIVANKTNRKVYAVDSRNHGDSEWSDVFNLDLNAYDLLHFMDIIGEKKAILVGHSMGGITAMRAALTKPEKIEKIVVEDMRARTHPEHLPPIIESIKPLQKLVKNIPPELTEEEAQKFCIEEYDKMLPKKLQIALTEGNCEDKKARHHFPLKRDASGRYANKANIDVIVKALAKPDTLYTELTGIYNGPAHFICGKLSVYKVFEDADHIRQFFPTAKFTVIENASHCVHDDNYQEFLEALLKALL